MKKDNRSNRPFEKMDRRPAVRCKNRWDTCRKISAAGVMLADANKYDPHRMICVLLI